MKTSKNIKEVKEVKEVKELSSTEIQSINGGGRYEVRYINGGYILVYIEDKK